MKETGNLECCINSFSVTGSLSYSISKATVDERYDERRLMLRKRRGDKSKEYFVAGCYACLIFCNDLGFEERAVTYILESYSTPLMSAVFT